MPQEIEPKGPAEECLRKRAIGELHGLTLTTGTDEAVERSINPVRIRVQG
jgi:hypothetical protein